MKIKNVLKRCFPTSPSTDRERQPILQMLQLYVGSDKDASYLTGAVLTVDGGWTCGYARDF